MKNNKKLIGTRINAALADRKITQKELADYLKVKPNVISYFCSGERTPNTEQIIMIAEYLNVSTDYLLGRTKSQNIKDKMRAAVDVTGLSDSTINTIQDLATRDSRIIKVIDAMFESEYFVDFVLDVIDLLTVNEPERYFEFDNRHCTEERKLLYFFMNEAIDKFKRELLTDEKLEGVLNNGKH